MNRQGWSHVQYFIAWLRSFISQRGAVHEGYQGTEEPCCAHRKSRPTNTMREGGFEHVTI